MNKSTVLEKMNKVFTRITNNTVCDFTSDYPSANVQYVAKLNVPEFKQKSPIYNYVDNIIDPYKYNKYSDDMIIKPNVNNVIANVEDGVIFNMKEIGPVNYSFWYSNDLYRYGEIKEYDDYIIGTFYCIHLQKITDPTNTYKVTYKQVIDVSIEYIDYTYKDETTINIKFYTKQNDCSYIEYFRYLLRLSYYLVSYEEGVSKTNCDELFYIIKNIKELYGLCIDNDTISNFHYNDLLEYKTKVDDINISDLHINEIEKLFLNSWLNNDEGSNKYNFTEINNIITLSNEDFFTLNTYYNCLFKTVFLYEKQKTIVTYFNDIEKLIHDSINSDIYSNHLEYPQLSFLSKTDALKYITDFSYIHKLNSNDFIFDNESIMLSYYCGVIPE